MRNYPTTTRGTVLTDLKRKGVFCMSRFPTSSNEPIQAKFSSKKQEKAGLMKCVYQKDLYKSIVIFYLKD